MRLTVIGSGDAFGSGGRHNTCFHLTTTGATSTALRLSDGTKTLSYSGDTQWTDALLPIASGADLFIVECYDYERDLTGHLNWKTIHQRLNDFRARQVMITHMNPTMLARIDEAKAAGVL